MWIRQSMLDRTIELGVFDRWVITSLPKWAIPHWQELRFVRVPEERVWLSIRAALAEVRDHDVPALWHSLYECRPDVPRSVRELAYELTRAARDPIPGIIVLERLIERGRRTEPLIWKPWPVPPRTQSEHSIVVEAVDPSERPVPGVRLEFLIADGEVRSAETDAQGIARLERVHAGRVVIRVLDIDGALWRPLSGTASQPSDTAQAVRWHEVKQGECLAHIAHRYGLKGWKELWEHAKNQALREKRKSPHVLLPGDQVAVPGVAVHEFARPTDATHRIEVRTARAIEVRVRVQNLAGEPVAGLSYDHRYRRRGVSIEEPGTAPTDAEGWLRETIPVDADALTISLRERELSFDVAVSSLDPACHEDTKQPVASGIQKRLLALGYDAGPPARELTPQLRAALATFQALAMQGSPTGEPDAHTIAALERAATV